MRQIERKDDHILEVFQLEWWFCDTNLTISKCRRVFGWNNGPQNAVVRRHELSVTASDNQVWSLVKRRMDFDADSLFYQDDEEQLPPKSFHLSVSVCVCCPCFWRAPDGYAGRQLCLLALTCERAARQPRVTAPHLLQTRLPPWVTCSLSLFLPNKTKVWKLEAAVEIRQTEFRFRR